MSEQKPKNGNGITWKVLAMVLFTVATGVLGYISADTRTDVKEIRSQVSDLRAEVAKLEGKIGFSNQTNSVQVVRIK